MNKKILFSVLVAAVAMTACNDDVVNNESENEVISGKPATLTLGVKIDDFDKTRAETLADVESKITEFHLYIFKANKKLEQCIDVTDASKVGDLQSTKELKIATTTGVKYMIASANQAIKKPAGTAIAASDTTLTFDDVKSYLCNIDASTSDSNKAKRITSSLPMVGSIYYEIKGRTSEWVEIPLDRTLAKADVIKDSGFDASLKTAGNFSAATVTYTVRNVAKKAFYSNITGFNTTTGAATTEIRLPSSLTYYSELEGSATPATAFGTTGHTYFPENTLTADAQGKVLLNSISYLLVTIDFTPAKIVNSNGVDVTSTANKSELYISYTASGISKGSDSKVIWYDSKAAAAKVGIPYRYLNQKMYFRVNLIDNTKTAEKDKYSIVRNRVYNVTLKSVRDFNQTTPACRVSDLDGIDGQTLGTSNLNVNVAASNWNTITMDNLAL